MLAARGALAWGAAYPELAGDSRYDAFRSAYAYAELVGPRGPVVTDRLSAFITIQGPGVLYPPHAHPAPEVYWVAAGTARWRRGHEGWVTRPPGSFIFHRSGLPHSTQTENEPLLALAFWTDHLDGASVMVRGRSATQVISTLSPSSRRASMLTRAGTAAGSIQASQARFMSSQVSMSER